MSKLSIKDIEKIAKLSRIEIDQDSKMKLVDELSSVLDFVDDLQSLDLGGIKPVSQVTGLQDIWREDVVVDCSIPRDKLLSNAPELQNGYFKVKKVL